MSLLKINYFINLKKITTSICIKEKIFGTSSIFAIIYRNEFGEYFLGTDINVPFCTKEKQKYKIVLNNNRWTDFFLVDVTKDYLEFNQNDVFEESLKIINVWLYQNKQDILSGTDKHFCMGRYLMIEKII